MIEKDIRRLVTTFHEDGLSIPEIIVDLREEVEGVPERWLRAASVPLS